MTLLSGQTLILLVVLTRHLSNQKQNTFSPHYISRGQASFSIINVFVCYVKMLV